MGLNKKKTLFENSNSDSIDNSGQQESDIDGKPLDTSTNEYVKEENQEDIDGKPLNEYDEDLDGNPCKILLEISFTSKSDFILNTNYSVFV